MHNDVECTFGILKGHRRLLKMGVHSSNLEYLDKIFKTCCALHNLFLDVDGLDKKWDKGKKRILL